VGRDLPRKLSRGDRLVGALLMDAEEAVPAPATALAAAAGFLFGARDEKGELFPADLEFAEAFAERGADWAIAQVCGLEKSSATDARIAREIGEQLSWLEERPEGWLKQFLESSAAGPGRCG